MRRLLPSEARRHAEYAQTPPGRVRAGFVPPKGTRSGFTPGRGSPRSCALSTLARALGDEQRLGAIQSVGDISVLVQGSQRELPALEEPPLRAALQVLGDRHVE